MSKGAFPEQEGRTHDCLIVSDFAAELVRLRGDGWRVDEIWPAEEPHTALLSRDDERVRLGSLPDAVEPATQLPWFQPGFILTRAAGDGGEGRAGMRYRDLLPGRLGGRYVASHITIAEGGLVDDWIHYHGVAFQMIFVRRGWVRVVYEDQGDPFVMRAGDVVLQPPYIRHRVLESSPGLEVIEIGCPALYKTFSDHSLQLPNGLDEERGFSGQHFLRHTAGPGETGMMAATGGLADVRTVSPTASEPIHFEAHDGELVFGFVLAGSARLDFADCPWLSAGDAFAIPPHEAWSLSDPSPDFRLLHVTTSQMPREIPDPPAESPSDC